MVLNYISLIINFIELKNNWMKYNLHKLIILISIRFLNQNFIKIITGVFFNKDYNLKFDFINLNLNLKFLCYFIFLFMGLNKNPQFIYYLFF